METEAKKGALTAAERQAKRREKAAEKGLKSVSVGLIQIEHEQAFKDAAKASRNGNLELQDGLLIQPVVREVVREVEKPIRQTRVVRVVDLEPLAKNGILLIISGAIGVFLGLTIGLFLWR